MGSMDFRSVPSTVSSRGPAAPPDFLRLAGHPVRWQLLGELARSDRQVRELSDWSANGRA